MVNSVGKESACNTGDPGSIPGLGRSPEEGKCYPLQCSGLENSMNCIVHGVAKSRKFESFTFRDSEEFTCSAGYPGLIPGSERSPGEGNGNPFQHSCLENSMDRRAW